MGSYAESLDHTASDRPFTHPALRRFRPLGRRRPAGVLGPGMLGVTWPVNPDAYAMLQAQHNLEQVGEILRRMELTQAEIVQLRVETRAILARLAA